MLAFSALDTVGLPASGDISVLVAAASRDDPLPAIAALGFLGAMMGDHAAFWFARVGRAWLARFIRVGKTEQKMYARLERNAPATLIVGRLVAAVRSEVALAAGASSLSYARFTGWNALGCALWAIVFTALGRGLADTVDVDRLAGKIHRYGAIIAIAAVAAYVVWWFLKRRRDR